MAMNAATTLAMAAVCLAAIATTSVAYAQTTRPTVVVKHRPIVSQGDVSESWDARQNVIDGKRYEQLLATNPASAGSVYKGNAARSPTRNCIKAASRASIGAEPPEGSRTGSARLY